MAEITPAKNNIFVEETDFRSAVSEQLLQKVGGSINFINDKQMCTYDFKFFGKFRAISGGEDGAMVMPFNIEICAISFRLRDCGSSGNTTVDLHKISTAGADSGSIFTNKIIIAHNETNEKGFMTNFVASTSNNVDQSASQLPTMTDSNRLVNAGESIRLDIDGNATDAQDLVVYIYYRPV
tara:strand:+ start:1171 stop:1713 length:543 start_codon:yes stop_codon:yes gene_type:complete